MRLEKILLAFLFLLSFSLVHAGCIGDYCGEMQNYQILSASTGQPITSFSHGEGIIVSFDLKNTGTRDIDGAYLGSGFGHKDYHTYPTGARSPINQVVNNFEAGTTRHYEFPFTFLDSAAPGEYSLSVFFRNSSSMSFDMKTATVTYSVLPAISWEAASWTGASNWVCDNSPCQDGDALNVTGIVLQNHNPNDVFAGFLRIRISKPSNSACNAQPFPLFQDVLINPNSTDVFALTDFYPGGCLAYNGVNEFEVFVKNSGGEEIYRNYKTISVGLLLMYSIVEAIPELYNVGDEGSLGVAVCSKGGSANPVPAGSYFKFVVTNNDNGHVIANVFSEPLVNPLENNACYETNVNFIAAEPLSNFKVQVFGYEGTATPKIIPHTYHQNYITYVGEFPELKCTVSDGGGDDCACTGSSDELAGNYVCNFTPPHKNPAKLIFSSSSGKITELLGDNVAVSPVVEDTATRVVVLGNSAQTFNVTTLALGTPDLSFSETLVAMLFGVLLMFTFVNRNSG